MPAILMSLWAGFSALLCIGESFIPRLDTAIRIGKSSITQESYAPFHALVCVWAAFSCLRWFMSWTDEQASLSLKLLRYSASIAAIYGFIQFLLGHKVLGPLGNQTFFSTWLAITLPLFSGLYSFPVFSVIALCGSTTAILTAFASSSFKNLSLKPFILCVVALFAICLIRPEIATTALNDGGRVEYWRQTVDFWKSGNLLIGQGLDSVLHVFHRHAHNEYIEVLATLGIVGVCLMAWVIFDAFKRVAMLGRDSRSLYGGIIAAGTFSALTLFTWSWTATGILILFALGRTYAEVKDELL